MKTRSKAAKTPPAHPAVVASAVLSEANGSIWPGFVKKVAGGGTTVEPVVVDGEDGLYLTGDDHYDVDHYLTRLEGHAAVASA